MLTKRSNKSPPIISKEIKFKIYDNKLKLFVGPPTKVWEARYKLDMYRYRSGYRVNDKHLKEMNKILKSDGKHFELYVKINGRFTQYEKGKKTLKKNRVNK